MTCLRDEANVFRDLDDDEDVEEQTELMNT